MKKKSLRTVLITLLMLLLVFSCSKENVSSVSTTEDTKTTASSESTVRKETEEMPYGEYDDLSENVPININFAVGNRSRTITYNQSAPLELSNGEVVTAGMLKPLWQRVEEETNTKITDKTIQDAKAKDMIQTESTSGFSSSNIYGGEGISSSFMNYGVQGKFVDLSVLIDNGYMPNFAAYLDKNPSIRTAITAYDGGIYYVPYIAEIGNAARQIVVRQTWITDLLDAEAASFDTTPFTTYYEPFYVGDNVRYGENGGSVSPKEGVVITKKTSENAIELQNNLPVKNGETLANCLRDYIERNYDYENASELYLGEKAAYDMDELVALMRVIKANPSYLTDGRATEVWPFFPRQASYREDLLRYGVWYDGARVHGTDTYLARWEFNEGGNVEYTYSKEETYENLLRFADMNAEGLLYRDSFDLTNKGNMRTVLWGTDESENPSFGWMTYDWIQSSTSDSLNSDTVVILPPVAKVNGVWQYYNDNTRAIKPDGWAISVAGSTEAQIKRCATIMDWFFSEDGTIMQSYGLIEDVDLENMYEGPNGTLWPKMSDWTFENSSKANGDISTFLRDWMGCLIPIGYPKQIGFEYQNTSERGFAAWDMLLASNVNYPSYEGEGPKGYNPFYYKLVPSAFSLSERQQEILSSASSLGGDDEVEYMFNIIRYAATGNAPSGVALPKSYEDYYAYFQSKGVETYQQIYQTAYMNMQAE